MKRLLSKAFLLFIPILGLIYLFPIDKRYYFQGLKDDCSNHGIWIYDRLYNNNKPIDIIFLGSSHTMNGINEKIIEEKLEKSVVNFGYCRLGRNLHFIFLKEMLKTKNPKKIVIEVLEDEDRYSHPVFPYLADNKDVLLPNPFFNRDILIDMFEHTTYKVGLIKLLLFNREENGVIRTEDFGFLPAQDTASLEKLIMIKEKRKRNNRELKKIERDFHMSFPRSYLKDIYALCQQQEIELIFLYLPSFETISNPKEMETYLLFGQVLIPPKEIMSNMNYWYDENHLNVAGAAELSKWVAEEIEK